MAKSTLLAFTLVFWLPAACLSHPLLETKGFVLSMDSYLRLDTVSANNTVDLDSSNSDDKTTYLGIDYNLGFTYESKQDAAKFYLKLERNGPGDYNAPLFVHNTLINSGGRVEKYRNEQLLPQLEEFWLDIPLSRAFGFKAGLYTYEVGYGFSLNGSYENFGLTFYQEKEGLVWRLYYCRPDAVYKNPLGPHIPQEKDQGYEYNHNASNFFAADVKFGKEGNFLQPYIGVLSDYTSSGKRDNVFSAPVKQDLLGTAGLSWGIKREKLFFRLEGARNFGRAESASSDYKDIEHGGYLVFTEAGYQAGKLTSLLGFLLASGNKVTPEMAVEQVATLSSGKNRAFSSYSPLNKNLGDSISACNAQARPVVFMGSGCGQHLGVSRPRTLAASDFDNLLMPSLGFDLALTSKAKLGLYHYYLMSFTRPVGTLNGKGRYLSRELGYEADLFFDYKLNRQVLLSFLSGYFLPGRYYKTQRSDTEGSLFNPTLRSDGAVDAAFQVELAMEFKF